MPHYKLLAINRVEAIYPPQAAAARIFGTVVVEVTVDENGNVASVRPLSGHPLLKDAATDAARGWTFKPTIVNGKPIKVLGTLSFFFQAARVSSARQKYRAAEATDRRVSPKLQTTIPAWPRL